MISTQAARDWAMKERKGHILFVDSDRDTCYMVSILLSQAGYDVTSASTVTEGLEFARSNGFDMILLDSRFEDGEGIELCRAIRDFNHETPIFFYTGITQESETKKMLGAGAQGLFIKPVDVENLLSTTSKYIEGDTGKAE